MKDSTEEEVLLRHEFIVGDVTTGLLSLGQLYQSGWKISPETDDGLFLIDPHDEVQIPVHYRNKSFAIRAHVRAVEDLADEDSVGSYYTRAIVAAHNEIEDEEMNQWNMTSSGAPYYKSLGSHYVDPRSTWGHYWPFRSTLIRVY